jgi:hypothetical protein
LEQQEQQLLKAAIVFFQLFPLLAVEQEQQREVVARKLVALEVLEPEVDLVALVEQVMKEGTRLQKAVTAGAVIKLQITLVAVVAGQAQ